MAELRCTCNENISGELAYCDTHELARIQLNGDVMTVRGVSRAKAAKLLEGLKREGRGGRGADGAGGVIFVRAHSPREAA
jgi:hypothetical protein